MLHRTTLLLLAIGLGVPGCTHSIRRAALVPHQQPIAHNGTSVTSPEVSVGSPNLVSTSEPTLASGQNAGIVIPRWQGQGALRVPLSKILTLGLHVDYGANAGSVALSDDQPDPKGDTMGAAASLLYSLAMSPEFDLGVAAQLWFYSVPYVEYDTCVNCPGGPYTSIENDRDLVPVVSVGLIPTYKVSPTLSVFGGLNARNHPTIRKSDITLGPDVDTDEEVEAGPFNSIASVGADLMLSRQVRLTGYLHQPLAAVPVNYGLSMGFMLSFVQAVAAAPATPAPRPGY